MLLGLAGGLGVIVVIILVFALKGSGNKTVVTVPPPPTTTTTAAPTGTVAEGPTDPGGDPAPLGVTPPLGGGGTAQAALTNKPGTTKPPTTPGSGAVKPPSTIPTPGKVPDSPQCTFARQKKDPTLIAKYCK